MINMVNEYCISSEKASDLFVGLRFHEGIPEVVFPHGFVISQDEKQCRKDILRLLTVLQRFSHQEDGTSVRDKDNLLSRLPLSSYQYVILDYLMHGYYTEKEIRYYQSQRGKINWKRTIQMENPQIDGDNLVYLDYQVRKNEVNNRTLLTEIHRYCVYESFRLFGWLYFPSEVTPQKPQIPFNKDMFLSVLSDAIQNTFDDTKTRLFQSMVNIVIAESETYDSRNAVLGVNRFDPVWEGLIDYVFGEDNKDQFFPHATWTIIQNGIISKSSPLLPDTIMRSDEKIYVLDAKYYQYGISYDPSDLPQTSSIQKQITYGKHISGQGVVPKGSVYNAFIMPFAADIKASPYRFVSVGTADWEKYTPETLNYAYVLGVLLDTRWLLTNYSKHNNLEIERLAELIEGSLASYKAMVGL